MTPVDAQISGSANHPPFSVQAFGTYLCLGRRHWEEFMQKAFVSGLEMGQ